jgi:hypothetical protein
VGDVSLDRPHALRACGRGLRPGASRGAHAEDGTLRPPPRSHIRRIP